jgi:hypothetical protein
LEGDALLTGSGEVWCNNDYSNWVFLGQGKTLTVGAQQTLRARHGSYVETNVVNHGLIEADTGSFQFQGSVVNDGVVRAAGGKVQLTKAAGNSGTLESTGGGTLEVSGSTGGRVIADGGTVLLSNVGLTGGSLRATDNAASVVKFSGDVTLNDVTWEDPGAGEFAIDGETRALGQWVIPAGGTLAVGTTWSQGGNSKLRLPGGEFTNHGFINLRGNSSVVLEGDALLTGSGEVWCNNDYSNWVFLGQGKTLTVGAQQTLRAPHGSYVETNVVNHGLIEADTGSFQFQGLVVNDGAINAAGGAISFGDSLTNSGLISARSGATLRVAGDLTVNGSGIIAGQPSGLLDVRGSLLGDTRNADHYAPRAGVLFDGAGTPDSPQLLEVMSEDLGNDAAGLAHNFAYHAISLGNGTYVRLVDQSDNAPGTGSEALDVDTVLVPSGTTVDLNGFHIYARAAQIGGTLLDGAVTAIPDSGAITLATATSGAIAAAGELDEWTFFDRAGRSVTTVVNPGSGGSPAPVSPYLGYAEVKLLDPSGNVLAAASNSSYGEIVSLGDVALPVDGTYRIQVLASAGHTQSTGNYLVTAWDVTTDVAPLVMNRQMNGCIETPYSVDRWTPQADGWRLACTGTPSSGERYDERR